MLSFLVTVTLGITGFLLMGDSFVFPGFSVKYFQLDSRILLLVFVFVNNLLGIFKRNYIPDWILENNRLLFLPAAIVVAGANIANYLLYPTYILNLLGIFADTAIYMVLLSGYLVYLSINPKWIASFSARLIYFLGPILAIGFVVAQYYWPEVVYEISQEDGVVEWIQVGLFLLASVAFFISARRWRKTNKTLALIFLVLSLGLLFVSAEEISWGQRLLGIETPQKVADYNYQYELTIHNLRPIQSNIYYIYMLIGLYGSAAYLALRKLAPKKFKQFNLATPHPLVAFYFFVALAYYFYERFVYFYYQFTTFIPTGVNIWQEIAELFLAIGFALFAVMVWQQPAKHS
jgi:hypothetical protein